MTLSSSDGSMEWDYIPRNRNAKKSHLPRCQISTQPRLSNFHSQNTLLIPSCIYSSAVTLLYFFFIFARILTKFGRKVGHGTLTCYSLPSFISGNVFFIIKARTPESLSDSMIKALVILCMISGGHLGCADVLTG